MRQITLIAAILFITSCNKTEQMVPNAQLAKTGINTKPLLAPYPSADPLGTVAVPYTLVSFTAKQIGKYFFISGWQAANYNITWTATGETNITSYELFTSSTTGSFGTWTSRTTEAASTSDLLSSHSFRLNNYIQINGRHVYFKLKINHKDSTVTYALDSLTWRISGGF